MKRPCLLYFVCACLISLSVNTNAVVLNTLNGVDYEWLELTETTGLSRDQVELRLADPNDELYGYEFASRALVEALFLSYTPWDGLDGYHGDPEVVSAVTRIISDFGITWDATGGSTTSLYETVDGYSVDKGGGYIMMRYYYGTHAEIGLGRTCEGGLYTYNDSSGQPSMSSMEGLEGWDATGCWNHTSSWAYEFVGSFLVKEAYDPPTLSIVMPGGSPQECSDAGSSTISINAQFTIDDADALDTISWKLDGSPVASEEFVNILVPLGFHNIEATVTTILGHSATDSTTITVEDTTAPVINTEFIDAKTGGVVTSIDDKDKAFPSYNVSDACDPAPIVVSATAGVPADNVDIVKAGLSKKDSKAIVSIQSSGDTIELTVTAKDAAGNISSEKAVLTIIP